jgi:hypothetical protein
MLQVVAVNLFRCCQFAIVDDQQKFNTRRMVTDTSDVDPRGTSATSRSGLTWGDQTVLFENPRP